MTSITQMIQEATNVFFVERVINGQNIELEIKYTPFEEGDFWTETVQECAEVVGQKCVSGEEIRDHTMSVINDLNEVELISMLPELEPCID